MYRGNQGRSSWDPHTSFGPDRRPNEHGRDVYSYPSQPQAGPSTPGPPPAFPLPHHFPSSLTPGAQRTMSQYTSPSNDLFFTGSPAYPHPHRAHSLAASPHVAPSSNFTRSISTPPSQHSQTYDSYTPSMSSPRKEPHHAAALTEEEEVARIMALSAEESTRQQSIHTQEEEEFARAIAQSMREEEELSQALAASMLSSPAESSDNAQAGPSSMPYQVPWTASPLTTPVASTSGNQWHNTSYSPSNTADDEAFARELAEREEEQFGKAEDVRLNEVPEEEEDGDLPAYDEAIASSPRPLPVPALVGTPLSTDSAVLSRHSSSASSHSLGSLSPRNSISSRSSRSSVYESASSERPGSTASFASLPGPNRPSSADMSSSNSSQQTLPPRPASSYLPTLGEDEEGPRMAPAAAAAVVANQFVGADLLRGVSLGFTAPVISADFSPLQGPMPNIISLPFGRCPPLHIQTPSWKRTLKLMASMGGTRVEPTLEAMSVARELKLRVVVQFVKVHHVSNDWRTIIWLSLDHPVPPSAPNAIRYNGTDPNILPWSYSLTTVPGLLRDGPDTTMSKAYTIPATTTLPFPTLPISFPDLAMYMHAARRDSPQGKLARIIKACYPQDETMNEEGGESLSVSERLKRRLGRSKKGTQGTGNDHTYDLVTPFVMSSDWQ